mmetsp:Transcript_80547/g.232805  ORF Transcript_80547/g.232805 Transcript_80547/m.232805 type:complete len:365 (-) Transcript_80547:98-1192(-)
MGTPGSSVEAAAEPAAKRAKGRSTSGGAAGLEVELRASRGAVQAEKVVSNDMPEVGAKRREEAAERRRVATANSAVAIGAPAPTTEGCSLVEATEVAEAVQGQVAEMDKFVRQQGADFQRRQVEERLQARKSEPVGPCNKPFAAMVGFCEQRKAAEEARRRTEEACNRAFALQSVVAHFEMAQVAMSASLRLAALGNRVQRAATVAAERRAPGDALREPVDHSQQRSSIPRIPRTFEPSESDAAPRDRCEAERHKLPTSMEKGPVHILEPGSHEERCKALLLAEHLRRESMTHEARSQLEAGLTESLEAWRRDFMEEAWEREVAVARQWHFQAPCTADAVMAAEVAGSVSHRSPRSCGCLRARQ